MGIIQRTRDMDKLLRVVLISTAILVIPQIGQFIAIANINSYGAIGDLALLFELAGILVIPAALILTGVILALLRRKWRENERIFILGIINLLIAANLIWFFIDQCSWAQVFGMALHGCHR